MCIRDRDLTANRTFNVGQGTNIVVNADDIATVMNPSFTTSVTSPLYTGSGAVKLSSGGGSGLTLDSSSGTISFSNDNLSSIGTLSATTLQGNLAWTYVTSQPNIVSSIEGVINDEGNIDLVEGNNISITGNDGANTITIAVTEGSGSGLDADTLDTLDSAQFLRSDVSDSFTSGTLTFNTGTTLDVDGLLDVSGTSTLATTTATKFTASGLITGGNGLTISSGTVSLPAGEIDNAELANSSLTYNAGSGLTGGGTVSLGSSATFNVGAGDGIDVSADSIAVDVTDIIGTGLSEDSSNNLTVVYGSDAGTAVQGNTQLTVSAGSGLSGGGTITLGSGGTVTLSHADTSSQGSVDNSGGTVIQDITLDTYGHITGLASYNLDNRYFTETETDSRYLRKDVNTTQNDGLYIATDQIRARDSGGLALYDDSGTAGIFVKDGGNVGIGTTGPGAKLDVNGTLNVSGASTLNSLSLTTPLDISSDTNLTAGRSLTMSGDSVVADSELYTDTKCVYIENPTADDDLKSLWRSSIPITFTKIWAESDQSVTLNLQEDDGSPANILSASLNPNAGTAESTSFADANFAAGSRLDLVVDSVSGTPTWVSICWDYQKND